MYILSIIFEFFLYRRENQKICSYELSSMSLGDLIIHYLNMNDNCKCELRKNCFIIKKELEGRGVKFRRDGSLFIQ